jgi:hypothetical protein
MSGTNYIKRDAVALTSEALGEILFNATNGAIPEDMVITGAQYLPDRHSVIFYYMSEEAAEQAEGAILVCPAPRIVTPNG